MAGYKIRCQGASGAWSEMGRTSGTADSRTDTFSTAIGKFSVEEIMQWDQALILIRRNATGDRDSACVLLSDVFVAVETPAIR